jgi:UDP-hydrolysing UDP-N-acetyl-D-glucosamine 2-epimerase|tara:strand:+ start:40097 stop:41287 length:1191 start_codon:yes stop_codon:yes gene_type:complete
MKKRKIGVVLGSRANYASIKSVMRELQATENIDLEVYAGAATLLDKFGNAAKLIESEGFEITARYYMLVEGETPETMALSTGLGIMKLTDIFMNRKPDMVVTVGDRFETMSTTIAAAYLNIHLVHTMGGEVSGTIDESIRHAITKFAHIHFPANEDARQRIIKLGEREEHVFNVGCPRIDEVKKIIDANRSGDKINEGEFWEKYKGVGSQNFSVNNDEFLLVMQHPVTTEFNENRTNMREILAALNELKKPTIMLWPNADAGSDEISKEIRTFREKNKPDGWLHIFKNLPMDVFVRLMDQCSVMMGNSSSQLREGAIVGVPAIDIGSRQQARLKGENIMEVSPDKDEILAAIKTQLAHGKYDGDPLYGDGFAGEKIAKILSTIDLKTVSVQKQICY